MTYNFTDKTLQGNYSVAVDPLARFGYFEHTEYRDMAEGGLWFDLIDSEAESLAANLTLSDYDGMAVLPRDVISGLRNMGFTVGEEYE